MRLIDADAVLGINEDEPIVWDDNDEYELGRRNMWRDWVEAINSAPTIDNQANKQAHWNRIDHSWMSEEFRGYSAWQCSNCMHNIVTVLAPPFCESCGAKMTQDRSRWIIDGHHIRCDNCGEVLCQADREGHTIPRNYCPNCGRVMDGDVYETN